MKLIVFSNSSFSNPSVRLGLQIMASQLAERGHEVDYLAVPTDPLDLFTQNRRSSFIQAWLKHGDRSPVQVSERLREYFLRSPFPRSRRFWRFENQLHAYSMLAPSWMQGCRYDACIRDTAMSGLFADRVKARVRVLRLNDNPDGLSDDVHPGVIELLKEQVNSRHFDEVWPVSETMLSTIRGIDSSVPAVAIPNGVHLERFEAVPARERRTRSAVYVGTFNHWFDVRLLDEAARLLDDWQIDLYGPYKRRLRPLTLRRNVVHHGPLPFEQVPATLAKYRVGLVPFAREKAILDTMDPLKVNQYLAAGLGVASTAHGSLGTGLCGVARFGDEPKSFATAVRAADRDCGTTRQQEKVRRRLRRVSWRVITNLVEGRLVSLLEARASGSP